MLSKKDFAKKVREMRRIMPTYNNGRRVVVLSADTKEGKRIIAQAIWKEGETLDDVYGRYSADKKFAYDQAWNMYCNSPNSRGFAICSHNYQSFSVAWVQDEGLTLLTSKTEYLVMFNS